MARPEDADERTDGRKSESATVYVDRFIGALHLNNPGEVEPYARHSATSGTHQGTEHRVFPGLTIPQERVGRT